MKIKYLSSTCFKFVIAITGFKKLFGNSGWLWLTVCRSILYNYVNWMVRSKFDSEPFPVSFLHNPVIRIFLKIRHLLTIDLLEKLVKYWLFDNHWNNTLVDTNVCALFWIIKQSKTNNNFCIIITILCVFYKLHRVFSLCIVLHRPTTVELLWN